MRAPGSTSGGFDRRDILGILTALGFSGALADRLAAQAAPTVSADQLRSAASLLSGAFDESRLAVARAAVERNLAQLRVVHDLDVPDSVEPPVVFQVRRS